MQIRHSYYFRSLGKREEYQKYGGIFQKRKLTGKQIPVSFFYLLLLNWKLLQIYFNNSAIFAFNASPLRFLAMITLFSSRMIIAGIPSIPYCLAASFAQPFRSDT